MNCAVCTHPNRNDIEKELLLRNFGDGDFTFKILADKYNVTVDDLKIHALMHMSIEHDESITDKIKLREADILRGVMQENYTTLKNISAKVNATINAHTPESPTLGQITKSVVELYLGCAQTIRETADSLVKMNVSINGDQNAGANALAELVRVLHTSVGNNNGN